MSYGSTAKFETMRSLAFGSIGAGFTIVGSAFTFPSRVLMVTNLTNQAIIFSDDGVNNSFILTSNSAMIIDMMTNRTAIDNAQFPKYMGISAKHNGVAPTSGAVYVSSVFCKGD